MVHHSKFLYSALVVSAMAVGANAQVTTSAISGKVLDETILCVAIYFVSGKEF